MPPSLTLITNIDNHYQRRLGEALYAQLGRAFSMVFSEPVGQERSALGWAQGEETPWVVQAWRSRDELRLAKDLMASADAVVRGAAPFDMVKERILSNKLTFTYSERPLKPSRRLLYPWLLKRYVSEMWPYDKPNHHLLAAGAYCATDMRLLGMFKGRAWKWGYFPEVPKRAPAARSNRTIKLLWAGRMIKWKRVDVLIEAVGKLRDKKYDVLLDLIGDGDQRNGLEQASATLGLGDRVRFLPPTTPHLVREAMVSADIYVLPSTSEEGWGAVINEAMASGCCVVSSRASGAAPWLITHGFNGYLLQSSRVSDLATVLADVLRLDRSQREQIGLRAWTTVGNLWSPGVAAVRLIALVEALLGRTKLQSLDVGPCSPCG